MGNHRMKTTIEISDALFEKVQELARKQKVSFRSLTEEGLRLVLEEKSAAKPKRMAPLVTFGECGLNRQTKEMDWEKIRDEIYKGRGT